MLSGGGGGGLTLTANESIIAVGGDDVRASFLPHAGAGHFGGLLDQGGFPSGPMR